MDNLIKLILKNKGTATDYRIEIIGLNLVPSPSVKLKVTYLPTPESTEVRVP